MSFLTGTQQENVYSLNTAVTKNTYTTAAAITAPGTTQARAIIPAGFFGSVPNGVGRGLYVHGSGTVATTSAATFIGQLCLNSTPGRRQRTQAQARSAAVVGQSVGCGRLGLRGPGPRLRRLAEIFVGGDCRRDRKST